MNLWPEVSGHKPSITWPRAPSFHTQLKKWSNGRMKEVFRSRQMPRVPLSRRFSRSGLAAKRPRSTSLRRQGPFCAKCVLLKHWVLFDGFFSSPPRSHILEITFICYSGYHMLRLKQQIIHFLSLFWKYKILGPSFKLVLTCTQSIFIFLVH